MGSLERTTCTGYYNMTHKRQRPRRGDDVLDRWSRISYRLLARKRVVCLGSLTIVPSPISPSIPASSSACILSEKAEHDVGGYPTLKKIPVICHKSGNERNLPLWCQLLPAASSWGIYLYSDSSGSPGRQLAQALVGSSKGKVGTYT